MMLCYNNSKKGWDNMSIYDFEVTEMSGEKVSLSKYKDQVILIKFHFTTVVSSCSHHL